MLMTEGANTPLIIKDDSRGGTSEIWNNPFMYLILLAFLGQWGGGNGGLFGAKDGMGAGANMINNDFIYSNLNNSIQNLSSTTIQGFSGLNAEMQNGFNAIKGGICDSTYAINNSIQNLGAQMASCCCETQKGIIEMGYKNDLAVANQTSTLIAQGNANTQAILDKLCQAEMRELQAQNSILAQKLSSLETSAIVQAQTQALSQQLCDIRNSMIQKPVYSVPFPFCTPQVVG